MEIIQRKDAKAAGLTLYFTGKPCKRGHVAPRYTCIGKCKDCSLFETRAAREKHLAAHPEILIAREERKARKEADPDRSIYFRNYRSKNKTKCIERSKRSAAKKKTVYLERRRAKRLEDRDKNIDKDRAYREKNKDRARHLAKLCRRRRPEHYRAKVAERRAKRNCATPSWADKEKIMEIYRLADELGYHVDHIVPIQSKFVCGLHCEHNLRPLPGDENRRKGNRFDPWTHIHELPSA